MLLKKIKFRFRRPPQKTSQSTSPLLLPSTDGAAAVPIPSLVMILTRHVLQDGELIILILKPSFWWILFSSIRFVAFVLIFMIAGTVFDAQLPGPSAIYREIGILLLACRFTWAALQWMGCVYILTDLRILRLTGVFNVNIYDCPLRKIARTRVIFTVRERLVGLGSIEIIPQTESCPTGLWQTIRHPLQVNEQILATIRRAKQGDHFINNS